MEGLIISDDIKTYRTAEEIKIATDFLELMKGKTVAEIKSQTILINVIASENCKL